MNHIIEGVGGVVKSVESSIKPMQLSAFRRFPIIFGFLVTFGVAATFFGIERIIADTPWLSDRPWLILAVGLGVLGITGRLHKKLD